MRIRLSAFAFALGLQALLWGSGTASAETSFCDYKLFGDVELGFRAFIDKPPHDEMGKLEEYRDLENPFVGNMHLLTLNQDESCLVEIAARAIAGDDQNYFLRGSKIGLFDFEFEWDQIPHLYSTTSPREDEIEVRRDTARFSFSYTPTPDWDILAEYALTNRDGEIPKGVATGFPGGLNFIEVLQPVDYNHHDVRLSTGYAQKKYQLQFSYNLSLFNNDDESMLAPGGGGAFDPTVALPPDSSAHTITLAGGVNLPYKTRVNGSLSYSLRLQTDDFVDTAAQPSQSDLDGSVNILNLYLNGVSRPINPLTIKTMYRLYHYDDESDELLITDSFPRANPIKAERFPYTRRDAAVDARWKFPVPVAFNAGFKWRRWERDENVLEVEQTDEYTPSFSLDYTPAEWLLLRTGYSHSIKVGTDYHPIVFQDLQQALIRKFTMANRDRDQVDFLAEFTPWSSVTVSTTFAFARDDYTESLFGLQEDEYWAAGADIAWSPMKRLSLSAGFLHEQYDVKQRSGSELATLQGGGLRAQDAIDTFSAGAKVILIPDKLDLDLRSSFSYAASDYNEEVLPKAKDSLFLSRAYFKYRLDDHWSAKLGYVFERFNITDSYADNFAPNQSIFLGDFYEDYNAHIIVGSIGFKF